MTWISIKEALPARDTEVEVLRDYGMVVSNPSHLNFGKRYGVERSTLAWEGAPNHLRARGVTAPFCCDLMSTGMVLYWRPLADAGRGDDLPAELAGELRAS